VTDTDGRGETRLLICAHRHGNDPALLDVAQQAGVDLVEVDLHLFRGALDARHSKTVGPLPIVWDRRQRPLWNPPRQSFDEVLIAAEIDTVFYVDLKGWTRRLSRKVIAALGGRTNYVVSSRVWWLLHPFRGRADVVVLRSIGAPWQLRWFHARGRAGAPNEGVSIHRNLLSPAVIAELKSRTGLLFAWGVTSYEDALDLERWGVDGVIVDDLEIARSLLERKA
jgi:glycerophosphoryl diester phosphodiesterase